MDLYIEETGKIDAPTIIFLHGGGGGAWMWQPVMAGLPEFHCLAPDLPEHGHSLAVKPFTIRGTAAMLANFIRERVPGGKAHVVGLSLGAQVGVALLSQAPEVVDHAVISSANLRPMPGASLGLYSEPVLAAAYWSSIAPLKWCDPWIRLNMKYAAAVPPQYWENFRRDFRAQTRDSWTHVMTENTSFRLPPGLERADLPVLVISGQKEYAQMRQVRPGPGRCPPQGPPGYRDAR